MHPSQDDTWAQTQYWYHSLDLGKGLVTSGRFSPNVPPNFTVFGALEFLRHMDLEGARCVNVGTMDGLIAFTMKKAGAASVLATDIAPRQTFKFARRRLGLEIDYRVPVPILELADVLTEKPDVLAVLGVIYHLLDPMTAIAVCRRSIRRNGYLILETAYDVGEGSPRMVFNPADSSPGASEEPNVFWRPSKAALEAMCQLAGFDVVASIAIDNRLTLLARAVRPSQIQGRGARIRGIHGCYDNYKNYCEPINFAPLEHDIEPASSVKYHGLSGHRRIYPAFHRPVSPLQPAWVPPKFVDRLKRGGRSVWLHAIATAGSTRGQASAALARPISAIKKRVLARRKKAQCLSTRAGAELKQQ